MQDEELDKIINDAANQHHPAYDDEAWGKMHALLNKQLPQKKDRRKALIFWLLFLLLGSTAVIYIVQQSGQNSTTGKPAVVQNTTTAAKNIKAGNAPAASNITTAETNTEAPNNKPIVVNASPAAINNAAIAPPAASNSVIINTGNSKIEINTKGRSAIKIKKPEAVYNDIYDAVAKEKKVAAKTKATVSAATAFEDEEKVTAVPIPFDITKVEADIKKETTSDTTSIKIIAQQKDTAAVKPQPIALMLATQQQNHSKKFKNNFMLTISGGVDKSFIKASSPGKTKTTYGIGASYTINNRLRVHTGFYASKKVYDAQPSQYKFPNGTPYPNLWLVNANCKVYEIPVNFYYSFAPGKKHNWFAGGGIASLLMKREHYNYKYKTPSGQYYNYEHVYTNENKHLFSVITLAGGYQYNLNSRIQFMAEPYIKMPLSGIGAGAINLKSGGILFTAAIKPFATKR